MGSISVGEVGKVLESMYPVRDRIVPCFIGQPGIGKTEGVNEFAKKKGVKVVEFILSNTIPSEVSGIRMPDKDTKKMEVFDDARMASLRDGDILFFDEVLEAPDILRSACLTLIQSRIMASGRRLPDVMIVAASNPVASPKSMAQSFRDRFVFFEVKLKIDEWCKWFKDRTGKVIEDTLEISHLMSEEYGYNMLTPRKFTALFDWLASTDDRVTVSNWIGKEYSLSVAETILDLVDQVPKKTMNEMIMECLKDFELPADLKDMSAEDMLAALQAMDEWPEIESALANMEVEG